jgi:hypothetical protein
MKVAAVSLGDAGAVVGRYILESRIGAEVISAPRLDSAEELHLLVSPKLRQLYGNEDPRHHFSALIGVTSGPVMMQLRTTTAAIQGSPSLQSSSEDMRRKGA